ncbi:MAG: hypothetical protein WDW36_001224 [Sanguina aurantia]
MPLAAAISHTTPPSQPSTASPNPPTPTPHPKISQQNQRPTHPHHPCPATAQLSESVVALQAGLPSQRQLSHDNLHLQQRVADLTATNSRLERALASSNAAKSAAVQRALARGKAALSTAATLWQGTVDQLAAAQAAHIERLSAQYAEAVAAAKGEVGPAVAGARAQAVAALRLEISQELAEARAEAGAVSAALAEVCRRAEWEREVAAREVAAAGAEAARLRSALASASARLVAGAALPRGERTAPA